MIMVISAGVAGLILAAGADPKDLLTGEKAFADATNIRPGVFRKITDRDLPKPYATKSSSNGLKVMPRPADSWPKAPEGFKVELYSTGLSYPRLIRAPNGDLFLADAANHSQNNSGAPILRGITKDGKPEKPRPYRRFERLGLPLPTGLEPQWVYIGNTASVIRLPYKNGDLERRTGRNHNPELPKSGPRLAILRFLWMAMGCSSQSAPVPMSMTPIRIRPRRAGPTFSSTPASQFVKIYASGIRNPVGIAVNPLTGELWCSVNERDELGDNLVPDYITHVQEGGFYGWPWYYTGSNQDPRHEGKHPELKGKVIVPDVLLQAHSASLEMTFTAAGSSRKSIGATFCSRAWPGTAVPPDTKSSAFR
jgi:glucose/arabinose dehydrogenase